MRKPPTRPLLLAGAILLAASVLPGVGDAQPKTPDERKEDRKERREDRKEHREEIKDEWKAKRKEWRDKREDRRKESREELKKKWGDLLATPAAREELRVHARRLARLGRIRFLAEAAGKKEVVERTDKAIAAENARHEKRMGAIKVEVVK